MIFIIKKNQSGFTIIKKNQSGFTIIEMAVVMVIIGFIVGFGASLIGPLSIRAKRIETTESIDAAMESIIGYATANQAVLPDAAGFAQVIRTRNDAWANPLHYIFDARLADGVAATGDLCTRRTTRITVNQCNDAACSAPIAVSDVAFVILSGGENFNNQTAAGLAITGPTVINVYPAGTDGVDNDATDLTRAEAYDDIVKWATLGDLHGRAGCRGPRLSILNNELPPGRVGNAYSAEIYVEGGVPFASGGEYLWCIETHSGLAPSNLDFRDHSDSDDIDFTTDGASLAESSGTWTRSDSILVAGNPDAAGSFLLTVRVRDNSNPGSDAACDDGTNQDNCAHRAFVLTINPNN